MFLHGCPGPGTPGAGVEVTTNAESGVGVREGTLAGLFWGAVGNTGVPFKINKGKGVCVGIESAAGSVMVARLVETAERDVVVENTDS